MTSAGYPICFSFNMAGCKQAKVGERCSKGYHQCSTAPSVVDLIHRDPATINDLIKAAHGRRRISMLARFHTNLVLVVKRFHRNQIPSKELPFAPFVSSNYAQGAQGCHWLCQPKVSRPPQSTRRAIDVSRNILHICLDLANDEAVKYVLALLKQPGLVFYLHAAPPCGTASRAREKKLSWKVKALGAKEPQPLRSEKWPHGIPGLKGSNLRRVTTANDIYRNVALLCKCGIQAGAFVSIENPSRSYLWLTKWMKDLIEGCGLFEVRFQQCMWGGARDKWSSWFTNAEWLVHER